MVPDLRRCCLTFICLLPVRFSAIIEAVEPAGSCPMCNQAAAVKTRAPDNVKEEETLANGRLSRPWYIIIEGAIGVGKTTLALLLCNHFSTELLLEVFEENPFLARFYESRARYAFQTQMFFLLSRYRQQLEGVPHLRARGALISDYMFDKDWLFAQLNLAGDEWEIYQQLHSALAQQVQRPDLLVYLQADTDVLMGRIALRDRHYERGMDRDYIEALRKAYEAYFAQQRGSPVLTIDTNDLNFVTDPDDFQTIIARIQSELQEGAFQQALPYFDTSQPAVDLLEQGRPLTDYQVFHQHLDHLKGFSTDLFFNYLRLSEEIGELGSVLADFWSTETQQLARGLPKEQARVLVLDEYRQALESELADCLAYLLKLANYGGINLETAYLSKMKRNETRSW